MLSSLHPGQSLLKRSAMETEMLGCFLGRFVLLSPEGLAWLDGLRRRGYAWGFWHWVEHYYWRWDLLR